MILGQTPADYDVATAATPEQVMAVLPFRAITVGISFGVVRVRHPRLDGVEVEVATFRSDGAYVDGRRPESVVFGSPELDAARRDFTINGMFMDPLSGEVIDFVGGQADLANHILRAIGDPVARLTEDRLRSLRAIRMAARFQLQIEPATRAALRAMAGQITGVSVERIAQELRRMLVHSSRVEAMNLAFDTGLLAAILPGVVALKGLFESTPIKPEGDLWDHTMLVLDLLPPDPSFPLAFAALLHETGKPAAAVLDHSRDAFHDHAQAAAKIADQSSLWLKLSNMERERITWLVAHHRDLAQARTLPESKLKRILAHPGIDELLDLHQADALASLGQSEEVDFCCSYLKRQPSGHHQSATAFLSGHDLIEHGLKPGARFATLLEQIRDAQLEGTLKSKRDALEWLDRQLETTAAHPPALSQPDS